MILSVGSCWRLSCTAHNPEALVDGASIRRRSAWEHQFVCSHYYSGNDEIQAKGGIMT